MLVHGKGDDCDDDHLDNESSITTVDTIKGNILKSYYGLMFFQNGILVKRCWIAAVNVQQVSQAYISWYFIYPGEVDVSLLHTTMI